MTATGKLAQKRFLLLQVAEKRWKRHQNMPHAQGQSKSKELLFGSIEYLILDSYFIDNVDLEWCFRAKSKGLELVGTDNVALYHAIGERSANPLVRSGIVTQHNPARTYYSSRNRIHLYGISYSPWGWKIRDAVRFAIKASWLLIFSRQRKQYWQNISAGIRDARTLS